MYSHHAWLQQKALLLPKTHACHLQMECNEMWNFHRAPWWFLPPISICSQKACESAAVSLRVCVVVTEVGKHTSVCLPVCVCQQMPAVWTLEYRQAAFFCSYLRLMDNATVDWAEPVRAVQFCAVLDSARPGLAAQVLQNRSNYPVLCHPADELITASACFPLNLESQ